MKIPYRITAILCVFLLAACGNGQSSKPAPGESQGKTAPAAAETPELTPALFASRFNKSLQSQGKSFRMHENPAIKTGPKINTFQCTPTHQITLVGTVDKNTGIVINAMLVARGGDTREVDNIRANAIGMVAAYNPEITTAEAAGIINELVDVYNSGKEKTASTIYRNLRLSYGMQTDMGLSHFSVRPAPPAGSE